MSLRLHRRRALAVGIVLATSLAAPVAARAATEASIAISPDPVEDSPIAVSASGSAPAGSGLDLVVHEADYPCGMHDAGELAQAASGAGGAYTISGSVVQAEPGAYRVCVVLRPPHDPDVVVGDLPFQVRPATGSIALQAPAIAPRGRGFAFRVTGTSELTQHVFVNYETGRDCDTYYFSMLGLGDLLREVTAPRPFAFGGRASFTRDGRVLLCAYLQTSATEQRAIAVARASVLVSSACRRAQDHRSAAAVRLRHARDRGRPWRARQLRTARAVERRSCGR